MTSIIGKLHNKHSILIACVIVLLDQLTKFLASKYLIFGKSQTFIDNILNFTLVQNSGAAFGILQNQRLFFILFSIVVLIGIMYKWNKIPKKYFVPLGLVLGGLVGNLIDRIIFGYVVDFINFGFWPVFNVADSGITVAIIWILVLNLKK